MQIYQMTKGRLFSMPVMAYLTFRLLGKRICCSLRRAKVCGLGTSPLAISRLTQVTDLVTYCVKEDIPFTVFEDWSDILSETQEIV